MTYEELLQFSNIEVFITSDYRSFVFTIETYDEENEDISIKYYRVTKNENEHPTIEKLNNTIELLLSSQVRSNQSSSLPLRLIKIDKIRPEDEERRNEFIRLITSIEKTRINPRRTNLTPPPCYKPVQGPKLQLSKQKN